MLDKERAELLWAKLCTDCSHLPNQPCDCLEDIEKCFAEIREEQSEILKEHEAMRTALQIIAGQASDGLQKLQAATALSNIGPLSA